MLIHVSGEEKESKAGAFSLRYLPSASAKQSPNPEKKKGGEYNRALQQEMWHNVGRST